MFKKVLTTTILTITLALTARATTVDATGATIDKTKLETGVIAINYDAKVQTAVRIAKGDQKKDYILKANNNFPLEFGNGEYTITVLENAGGNKYREVEKEVVILNLKNQNDLYLQNTQMVNWNNDMQAVKLAKELTRNAKTENEKVNIIYNYVIKNIKYDNVKVKTVKNGYIPNIDQTLKTKDGICYDYATLTAGMLRGLNIQTKVVMGRNNEITDYHAWNEVYLKDAKKWIIIDTTYDAALAQKNLATTMVKDVKNYKTEKEH